MNLSHFLPTNLTGIVPSEPEYQDDLKKAKYKEYAAWLDAIKSQFPGCEPYEINAFLYTQGDEDEPLITKKTSFFQVSTTAFDNGIDYWEQSDELPEDGEERLFKEYNQVYKEGPGGEIEYPQECPERGDIILVRSDPRGGRALGRAIGVVADNVYASDGRDDGEEIISVYWINKTSTPISNRNMRQMSAFGSADELLLAAFRETDAYKVSFDWIDQLTDDGDSEPQTDPDIPHLEDPISFPLNTILFGPPGTGKTWEAVSHAVAIMDGKEPAELAEREMRDHVLDRF